MTSYPSSQIEGDPEVLDTPSIANANERGLSQLVNVAIAASAAALPPLVDSDKVKPIKRLTIGHRRMIALHLQGYSNTEIASTLERSPATVGAVLRNPTTRELIDKTVGEFDDRLKALIPLSIIAIRDGLKDVDNKVRLQAVDRLYKATGRFREHDENEKSAEDVVREIIKLRHGDAEVTIARETNGQASRRS